MQRMFCTWVLNGSMMYNGSDEVQRWLKSSLSGKEGNLLLHKTSDKRKWSRGSWCLSSLVCYDRLKHKVADRLFAIFVLSSYQIPPLQYSLLTWLKDLVILQSTRKQHSSNQDSSHLNGIRNPRTTHNRSTRKATENLAKSPRRSGWHWIDP